MWPNKASPVLKEVLVFKLNENFNDVLDKGKINVFFKILIGCIF